MLTPGILEGLPDGYFVEESPRGALVLHYDVARALHEVGFGPEVDGRLAASELSGRQPLQEIHGDGQRLILRRFSHGGLLRWLTGHRFRDPGRPFRELLLADFLRRVGVGTPQVVAARARRLPICGFELAVITRPVEDSIDLGYVLGMVLAGELDREFMTRLMPALGRLIRRLHAHGCLHADLQPANILISRSALDGGELDLWVLDLDRSQILPRLNESMCRSNLRRLYRHVSKREKQAGRALARTDYVRFFKGYDPDGSRWKEDWRRILIRHTFGHPRHRLGRLLESLFSGKLDPRARPGI